MGANHVELENFINFGMVEDAYRKALLAQQNRRQSFADTGWRAALNRDDRLLKSLEIAAKLVDQAEQDQYGQTMRSVNATFAESKGTTEAQLWREAYRLCDEGKPIRNFEWIYGAAAYLCGYNT